MHAAKWLYALRLREFGARAGSDPSRLEFVVKMKPADTRRLRPRVRQMSRLKGVTLLGIVRQLFLNNLLSNCFFFCILTEYAGCGRHACYSYS